jgi:hypothetical protein
MRYGSIEKTISGITVEKSTTQKLTITRASFIGSGAYAWTSWSAAGITGKAFMYPGNSNEIQMNSSKSAQYLFSNVALPGGIVSITMKTTGEKQWEVRTSSSPFVEGAGKTTSAGTSRGTFTSSPNGGTITINTTDKYFAINYKDSGAVYITELVITYNAGSESAHTHTPGAWITDSESTCKVHGSRHTECTGCGEVVNVEELPLADHKYGDWTPGANNTETRTCSVCGDVDSRQTQGGGETHQHTPSGWIVDSESTCAKTGTQHKECTACGEVLEEQTLPLADHKYGDWTPGANNTETRTCSVCGDVDSRQSQGENQDELDEEKVATFATLVNNVVEAEDLAEKWTSIKSALNYYNNLNANEKDAVAVNYATLEAEISAYNVGADALNSESKKATEDAIMLLAGTFSILAFAAYFLLRR